MNEDEELYQRLSLTYRQPHRISLVEVLLWMGVFCLIGCGVGLLVVKVAGL